ncbi:MAG: right-handed parallel beta-helix repeat-containing protein [Bacteroidales bacterium]|nr:right-handed parallel beta-helix repeat-containing protein [Bacteroidales bacterium]
MKTIKLILALLILNAGCSSENRTSSDKVTSDLKSVRNNALQFRDSTRKVEIISVVHPVIPNTTITVGGDNADIKGYTSEAIQTAVDALRLTGAGGTVKLLPGNYDIIAPVKLYDNIALSGSGIKTVLKKCKGVRAGFAVDADYGELQVTVADASGFKPGMGVAVYDEKQRSGWDLTTAKITSITDNTIYIDDFLVRDYHSGDRGTISNACSVISAVNADNVRISDLVVDGSRESNDLIDGCRAGGIYLHKVHKAIVENVIVRNFNSDGISWQITEYVTVRNCEVYGCANSGLHPGTGSPFTTIEGNNSHDNDSYGLFVCWRVRDGVVRGNNFHHNGRNGISTGHKDTDMLYAENHIYENGSDGIYLRDDGLLNEPHRSIFKNNLIENNGVKKSGYGLSVNCPAEGIVLEENIIRDTKDGKQVAAIFLSAKSLPVVLKNNKISGHPEGEVISEKNE